jgi:hypothetical protein
MFCHGGLHADLPRSSLRTIRPPVGFREPRRGVQLQAVLQARARKPLTLHARHSPCEAMARYKPCAGVGEAIRRAGVGSKSLTIASLPRTPIRRRAPRLARFN